MRRGAVLLGVELVLALSVSTVGVRAEEAPPVAEPPPAPPADPPPAAPAEPAPAPPSSPEPPPAPPPVTPPPAEPPAPTTAPWPAEPAPPAPAAPAPAAPPSATFPPAPASPSRAPARAATPRPGPAAPSAAPAPSSASSPNDAGAAPSKKALPEDKEPVEPEDDSYGVLGPFRIGPVVSVGLPSLLGFGGMVKLTRYVGAGVNVGLIPEVTFKYYGEAKVSYQEYSLYGHIHPFGGGFFLGAQLGYARVRGSYATTVDLRPYTMMYPGLPENLAYTSRATVQTLVLTPELGYFKIFGSGFSMGVDAGLQLPVAPSEITFERATVANGLPPELADRAFAPFDQKVHSTLEKVGRTILPAFHFRMGWLL